MNKNVRSIVRTVRTSCSHIVASIRAELPSVSTAFISAPLVSSIWTICVQNIQCESKVDSLIKIVK